MKKYWISITDDYGYAAYRRGVSQTGFIVFVIIDALLWIGIGAILTMMLTD